MESHTNKPARARGFAAMDQTKQREIARRGGRAAHALGAAHEFDAEEARSAGRKGGQAVSGNREHMAAIGRRGGKARHGQRQASPPAASIETSLPAPVASAAAPQSLPA